MHTPVLHTLATSTFQQNYFHGITGTTQGKVSTWEDSPAGGGGADKSKISANADVSAFTGGTLADPNLRTSK